ncbi:hypothetical protein [Beggiatoa leptomitoformis]|uniref:Uncharacterized protein n=1 Tax=Beggiatoa leptomitoformis TaxID=288004 RepID=A0A2N9YG52_9GAMM|nr:hypothetical protein [Beggiatoa leptomitoformis]ALG68215.1 hypothetical protein AL038_11455 [Beggiatoa leptomitoformis]AUI69480.1 hypothetical protein BLE401_12815 [Beggiatoa leptomitoformis]
MVFKDEQLETCKVFITAVHQIMDYPSFFNVIQNTELEILQKGDTGMGINNNDVYIGDILFTYSQKGKLLHIDLP